MTMRWCSGSRTRATSLVVALLASSIVGCAHGPHPEPDASFRLRLIGERVIDHRLSFGGTVVGGLSGIDYDPQAALYYLISDDRSRFSPARFYTARLRITADTFDDATLVDVVTLRRPDGRAFEPKATDDIADGEAIRFDSRTRLLWWTSEGERKVRSKGDRLIDPFVRATTLDGRHVDSVPLDPMFRMRATERGPRDNRVFEGLSLSADGDALWVSLEGPLLQDGPMPTATAGAWSRFTRYPRQSDGSFGAASLQLAYPIGPLPDAPLPFDPYSLNGVSEILVVDDDRMLVLERALVIGHGWRVRLFEARMNGASDVRAIDSLATGPAFAPMSKRLVLDFDTLGLAIDNLEGVCFGPTLPNGHRTLVFVSDDNFNPGEKTQLLAFEIVPR